jgi:hypothetical protein
VQKGRPLTQSEKLNAIPSQWSIWVRKSLNDYFPPVGNDLPSTTFHDRIIKLGRQKDFLLYAGIVANISNIVEGDKWIHCSSPYLEKLVRKGTEPTPEAQAKIKEVGLTWELLTMSWLLTSGFPAKVMDRLMVLTLRGRGKASQPAIDLAPTHEVFTKPKMLAPVELAAYPYLIYRHGDAMNDSELLETLYLLRRDVAKTFGQNVSSNTKVVKYIVAFVE